ncbi:MULTISPECIES: RibD family protein [Hydrocarboniphaga]|jgi:diaminohydroxyphosphoribosylaminopyrimidine deaminase/5-amino-6-(5-phosphoribosylamino)uracil reductase|uniref:Bacterial bifunctional deaminase-reductase C-terminal domain-containing protein n=1 Tax=Hydrocarboniphaga effusa AP103 TaxID=1172194 RepID=I8I575_9GAMM|nr:MULTISPECIES: RibD family protein [Hydrocarboniphaga]EIT71461.1 hypothetical protein WQQ_15980 [Hydrocarboniphaga effusa AP103]MDZ4079310.1 RibD family protein [Hydrocarboniphaga sp.]
MPDSFAATPLTAEPMWDLMRRRFAQPEPEPDAVWPEPADAQAAQLLDLYRPMLRTPYAVAQLGQSLDGYIATDSGDSNYVTGEYDRTHLHRVRALCDAVIVGAETVIADDPQLTVRHVCGRHPLRVILDPRGRVPLERKVFLDGAAPTLLLTGWQVPHRTAPGLAHERLDESEFAPQALLRRLHARGARRVLVEGGGVTVSRFLAAEALDRLFVTVAPLILGEGRRGLQLPPVQRMAQALRPSVRRFDFEEDVLFDIQLRRA